MGILFKHHSAMWLREWRPPADVMQARVRAPVAIDNPAKRPCTDQRAGRSSSNAVDLEGENDEAVAPEPTGQPEVADWEIDVFLRTIHAVTHKVLQRGDIFVRVSEVKMTLARIAQRKQEAQAELAKEKVVRKRHLHASAIKVLELQDVFATGAIPVMRSVVVQTGLNMRVEAALRRQQVDEALDVNALIHVYASFGGVSYTVRGVAPGYRRRLRRSS